MSLKKIVFVGLLLAIFSTPAFAFDIPEPNGYVTDEAGVFSYEEEMSLELQIDEIEKKTTAEIGILVVPTTDGEDISSVAFEVGNEWGVGKKENDNGLMILVAIEDRAWFMATGYGLEGTLPDAITKRIAERRFPPYFRSEDYAGGLSVALTDVEGYLVNDPIVIADYAESTFDDSDVYERASTWIWAVVLFFVGIFKAIWVGGRKKKNRMTAAVVSNIVLFIFALLFTTLPIAIGLVIFSILMDIAATSGASGGGGGSSSSRSSWSSSSSSSSWSSSSSGSSFGGGSFGGGGSGGRW